MNKIALRGGFILIYFLFISGLSCDSHRIVELSIERLRYVNKLILAYKLCLRRGVAAWHVSRFIYFLGYVS